MTTELDAASVPTNDEKNIATVTHLGGTVFSFIPALIVWLLKKTTALTSAIKQKRR